MRILPSMLSIRDLLNPLPEVSRISSSYTMPNSPISAASGTSLTSGRKVKLAKDAAVFRPGKPQGIVRYPPCEERDEELAAIHRAYKLHPWGKIASYPRNIPYQSDKKSFQERTGRDYFEGKEKFFLMDCFRRMLISFSLSIHLPDSRRRNYMDHDVGLQYRTSSHHPLVQM